MQHRSRARQWTDKHRCQRQGVERAESNERYHMGSSQDLIAGNWLISKHICENRTKRVRSLGTAADLAGQLEAAAHAIVHAMKPSDTAEGALAPATRSCVGARSLRAHRGQARPTTV
ncbi:hypothetical protein ERJ75_000902500 [Trypanosoma vivax]|nr:hypothetical protein ERJ75_000902500 [Trypanosoma vivax]